MARLAREPFKFEFFQAVRLLERAGMSANNGTSLVAEGAPPSKEVVRFSSRSQLTFNAADIQKIGPSKSRPEQYSMEVNFTGLAGSQGVLPHYLSEIIQLRQREKDSAFKDYLDIFNHRNVSLLYKSWQKHRLPAAVERHHLANQKGLDIYSDILCSLAGFNQNQQHLWPLSADSVAGVSGLLARTTMTADSLAAMIKHQFGLTVSVEQFIGQWQSIDPRVQTRLPSADCVNGLNNQLGKNVVIGSNSWQLQNRFRVHVEPLDYQRQMQLTPGSAEMKQLTAMIKLAAGVDLDFDISITVDQTTIQSAQLIDKKYRPILGWNTHLSQHDDGNKKVTNVLISPQ
nr:type VI secretion system baseplate subunit TssG [Sinobacterium norvegicum]